MALILDEPFIHLRQDCRILYFCSNQPDGHAPMLLRTCRKSKTDRELSHRSRIGPVKAGAAIPTLFTKIINREIPAEIVYEDEHCVAFRDINPQAPVHILIVPRQEIPGLASLPENGDHTHLLNAARKIAEQMQLNAGYRVVINEGIDAGQTVDHLHAHLLGGRKLGWPPG